MVNQLTKKPPARKKASQNGNSEPGTSSNVKVVVRVRPRNSLECLGNHQNVVRVMDERMVAFDPKDDMDVNSFLPSKRPRRGNLLERRVKDLKFIFDRVFDDKTTNQDVFDHTTRNIISGVLNGYNCTVFAYGATGAGKTHTMLGNGDTPGVMFLTMMELYSRIEAMKAEQKTCDVAVSYLEVYNETIRDLLMPGKQLAVREDPRRGVCVPGLTLHQPRNAEELFGMLEYGNRNRSQHPTDANATSSRSHAVFQVFVRQQNGASGLKTDIQVAKMSLIDLAGSERATVTTNSGARFREGANINKSLLALGNCINALAENKTKNVHIPYRDSKLTRILKDSLGGNCRTVMIAAVSPSNLSYEDTYNTLKYADRAKNIKSSLVKNVLSVDVHVSRYAKLAQELQEEVARLKTKLNRFETGEATPLRKNLVQTCKKEEMEKLQSDIKTVYDERSTIKKELVDTECLEKELMEKLKRKQNNMEWMNLLCRDNSSKTYKVETRVRKCLSATKCRVKHLKERKDKLEGRLRQNDEWLQRTHSEVKMFGKNDETDSQMSSMFVSVYETSCGNELKHKELQQQCKYYKKCLEKYESQRKREKRLIGALLNVVRKQFSVLKSAGMVTNEYNEDYEQIVSIVEDNREVAWADQTAQPVKSTDPNEFIKMIDENLATTATEIITPSRNTSNFTPCKPVLSCNFTPRRAKTPSMVLSSTLSVSRNPISPFVPRANSFPVKPDVPETPLAKPVRQNLLSALNETNLTTTTAGPTTTSVKTDTVTSSETSTVSSVEAKGLGPTDGPTLLQRTTTFNPSRSNTQADRGGMSTIGSGPGIRFQQRQSANVQKQPLNVLKPSSNVLKPSSNILKPSSNVLKPSSNVTANRSLPLRENNGVLNNQTVSLSNNQSTNDTSSLKHKGSTTNGNEIGRKIPSYAALTKSAAQKITAKDTLPKRSHSKENMHPQPKRRKLPLSASSSSSSLLSVSVDQSKHGQKYKSHVHELRRAVSMLQMKK